MSLQDSSTTASPVLAHGTISRGVPQTATPSAPHKPTGFLLEICSLP